MKKNLSLYILGFLFVTGAAALIYFGVQPKPVAKIDLSSFSNPQELGEAIYDRLFLELKEVPVFFLGVQPDSKDDYLVLTGLLKKLNVDQVFIDPRLEFQELISNTQNFDSNADLQLIENGILKAQSEKQRLAFIVPNIYSSLLVKENIAAKLSQNKNINIISFTLAELVWSRSQESKMPIPCITGTDPTGTGNLGCMILQKSRSIYRKTKTADRFYGLMVQTGIKDYIVLKGLAK